MPLHKPYHSSMEKEVTKAASILNSFFDSSLSEDNAVPVEFIRNCKGLAFLTVIKAGFIWSGKLGTGVVITRLQDGGWSPPSGIGTAGVGFGAEIGGEIIDFMLILNTDAAVNSFKKGAQVTVGAGLDLAIGPFGRAAAANIAAGGSGFSTNYTYSHAKGAFVGIGLRGSTILVRGDLNKKFYKEEVSPMQVLTGKVTPPSGSLDALYEAIRRAERGGKTLLEARGSSVSDRSLNDYQASSFSSRNTEINPRHSFERQDSGNHRASIGSTSSTTSNVVEDDPRLRRFSKYKSEKELYASFSRQKSETSSHSKNFGNSGSNTGNETSQALKTQPPIQAMKYPAIPSPAIGDETRVIFDRVLNFVSNNLPYADVNLFKNNCKNFGQNVLSLNGYMVYLRSIASRRQLQELIPDLVRLLPTEEKRAAVWDVYVREVLEIRS